MEEEKLTEEKLKEEEAKAESEPKVEVKEKPKTMDDKANEILDPIIKALRG